jgi:hypothetical protein
VDDRLRSVLRREFMLLGLGVLIVVVGLMLLWADMI